MSRNADNTKSEENLEEAGDGAENGAVISV